MIQQYWQSLKKISHNARMYLLTSIFMAIAIGIQLVLFNLYILELGFNEEVVGQLAALIAIGVAIGGLPAGYIYDRVGGKFSFGLATIGMTVTMAFMAISTARELLSLWSLLNGLANSLFFVSIFPYITNQSSPIERAHLYGMNLAVWSGFRVVGNLVAGYLPGLAGGMLSQSSLVLGLQTSLLVAALFSGLALLPLSQMRRKDGAEPRHYRRSLLPSVVSRTPILKNAWILFLSGLVIGLTQPFYNVYFKRVFEADTALIGILFSLSELTALVVAVLLPTIVARWGLISGSTIMIMLASPLTFAMGLPFTLSVIAIIFLVKVGLQWLGNTSMMNLMMEVVAPDDRGAMSGVRLVTNYGAQAIAGVVGGWIVVGAGYAWLFAVAALIQLMFGGMIRILFRTEDVRLETTAAPISD